MRTLTLNPPHPISMNRLRKFCDEAGLVLETAHKRICDADAAAAATRRGLSPLTSAEVDVCVYRVLQRHPSTKCVPTPLQLCSWRGHSQHLRAYPH